MKIVLRPVADEDIPLLTEWLHKDHIRKWYHEPNDWLVEINGRNGTYSWIRHFIAMAVSAVGDMPVGFCQYYDCYDARELESWHDVARRGDAFSIDYFIGEETYLGKGYGKALVGLLTETVREKERAARIIVQPEAENIPSCRVLLANGYRYDEENMYYCKFLK